jgi:hypothetical protein
MLASPGGGSEESPPQNQPTPRNSESPSSGPKQSRGSTSQPSTVRWLTLREILKASYNDNPCLHRLAEVPRSARFRSSTKTESTQQRITQKRSETKPRFDLSAFDGHPRRDPKGKSQRQSTQRIAQKRSETTPRSGVVAFPRRDPKGKSQRQSMRSARFSPPRKKESMQQRTTRKTSTVLRTSAKGSVSRKCCSELKS